jgi:hypothetical protein
MVAPTLLPQVAEVNVYVVTPANRYAGSISNEKKNIVKRFMIY